MRYSILFQKIREYSRFHWVEILSLMINKYQILYFLCIWFVYFLFDQVLSLFHPESYPFSVSFVNLVFGTPFVLFLFIKYFPAIRSKVDLGFLSLKVIELVIFLTVLKFIVFGFRDISFTHKENYLLLDEFLRLLHFAFFTFFIQPPKY